MGAEDACIFLKTRNKGINFIYHHGFYEIFSKIPAEDWIVPDGWYYDEKDGFTNKYNVSLNLYVSCPVNFIKPTLKERIFGL